MNFKKLVFLTIVLTTTNLIHPMLRRLAQKIYPGQIKTTLTVPASTNTTSQATPKAIIEPITPPLKKDADLSNMTAYQIFQLSPTDAIPKEEIKRRYRLLAQMHHPDTGGSHENFLKLHNAFKELNSELAPKNIQNNYSSYQRSYTSSQTIDSLFFKILKLAAIIQVTDVTTRHLLDLKSEYNTAVNLLLDSIREHENQKIELKLNSNSNQSLELAIEEKIDNDLKKLDTLQSSFLGKIFGKKSLKRLQLSNRLQKQKYLDTKVMQLEDENRLVITDQDLNKEFGIEPNPLFFWKTKALDPNTSPEEKERMKHSIAQKRANDLAKTQKESTINLFYIEQLKSRVYQELAEELEKYIKKMPIRLTENF